MVAGPIQREGSRDKSGELSRGVVHHRMTGLNCLIGFLIRFVFRSLQNWNQPEGRSLSFHKSKSLDLHNMGRHEGVGRSLGRCSRAMADMNYTDAGEEVEILVGEPEICGVVLDDLGDENVEDNRIKPVEQCGKQTDVR